MVIGSNSFSGAHFIAHCLQAGMKVNGISRSLEPDKIFLPYRWNIKGNFNFFRYDLNHDMEQIVDLIRDFRPDYVVNFAAQGMVAESWQSPDQWMETNLVAAVRLHDKLRHCDFLRKFVQISTPEVYGNCTANVVENLNYYPSTPYAVSKAAIDMSLEAFRRNYGFPVIFTRAANVYGKGQQLYRIIPLTIIKFLKGEKIQLHGGGKSIRSFIHIKDVVRGTLAAAQHAEPGEIFHFSTTRQISIYDLMKLIASRMNVDFDRYVEIADERQGNDAAYLLDCHHARELLKWQPEIELETGIDEVIDWIKQHFDQIKNLTTKYEHKV